MMTKGLFRRSAVLLATLAVVSCGPTSGPPPGQPSGQTPGPSPKSTALPVVPAVSDRPTTWEVLYAKDLAGWKAKGWVCAVGVGRAPRYDVAMKKALFNGQVKVAGLVGGKNSTVTLEGVLPLGIPRMLTGGDWVEVGMVVGFKP